MTSGQHLFYYQCVRIRQPRRKDRLTLHHNLLASLLIVLTATTDLVFQPEPLMPKEAALLTSQLTLHELSLGAKNQTGVMEQGGVAYCDINLPPLSHYWHHCP